MNKTLLFALLAFLFVACTTQKEDEHQEAKTQQSTPVSITNSITDGEQVTHYPNGQVKLRGNLKDGKKTGMWYAYYENGVKQSENEYQYDILNGKSATFYPSGQLRYIGYFKNGKKEGLWEYYSKEGELQKSVTFHKGKIQP